MSTTRDRTQQGPHRGQHGDAAKPASADPAPRPIIEQLLAVAHIELASLHTTARNLTRHGLASSALPSGDTLLAVALLGNHGRAQVEEGLLEHWAGLVDKGLVHGDIPEQSTPRLRLLLLVQTATEVLDGLRARMENGAARPTPPEVFRCASQVDDLMWGQPVRLDYWVDRADYLLIVPGRAFRRLPVLIHTGGGAGHGNIELPGDEGEVVFTLMGNDGEIYRHTTQFTLREADWLARRAA